MRSTPRPPTPRLLCNISFWFATSLILLTVATSGWAADSPATPAAANGKAAPSALKNDLPVIPDAVRQLLEDRKYAEAIAAIDEAAKVKDAPRDYLAYLHARALHLQQKYDEAVEAYKKVETDFPASVWARRAKFARAVALARRGDFPTAEKIYREEAERLLSADRKQEIAQLYLEFADAYFKPKDELQHQPDYAKSLEFYQKALEVGPKPESRAEIELRVARCYQQLNNQPEAAKRYQQFVKDHAGTPQEVEARFRLGEVQMAMNQPAEARRTWQDLLAAHADDKSERIAEATFKISETYGLPSPASAEALNLGVASLDNFLKKYPDHKLAAQAHLRIAQSYLNRGQHADAVKALDRFLADKRYADRDELADARNMLGRAYQLQKKFPEALAAWREYLAKHPAHHDWSQVQQEIVNTEYLLAADKLSQKQYDDARKLWTEFLSKYPLDGRNPRIMFQFGAMNYQQEKWDDSLADWRRLVSKYPGTNEASQGQFMIASTLENKLGKLDDALTEYRKVTWGSSASQAAIAAKRLTSKTLAIRTDRVFRTGETPTIKLTSRNIDTVTVRIYTVDLETYFRKMHEVSGVEGLDISLIDPDKTFEFKVPKYAEYQQLESDVEVPLPSDKAATSGVMAVTVSSKTLEATTLVMQSDLDIILKGSRDEVFVLAENMRTGKPWPKAKLLISNGQAVFAEGETGDDGVFQKSFPELKEAGDLRVFAVADGNVASNLVSLSGVGMAQGLADQGYIYTDRPVYRAGQLVHIRGVLRKADDDAWTVEKGKKYTVDVYDGRNRSVWQNDVTLSEFGSFHEHFLLPPTAPVGNYRIDVHDDDGHNFAGTFTVHEYQLEPVHLAVETDRKVFYRGEEIEGKITAKFYYGAPLVGREIRYQLAGDRSYTATTDDKGEVKFKLPTREFRETQVLPLVVTLAERNLTATQNFFLSTTGFSLSVSTVRPIYVSGETFEATVKAVDAEGKPLSQKVTLKVLQQNTVEGKVGETEIEKHELTTDKKDGIARQTLKLEKGARYVLRAEGVDRFENPITGQSLVGISDAKDRIRLRILADKHTFKVGDTADVQLHWREKPALALVTFQGAKILDYKLVTLETGANKLSIPMAAKLAPNFNLEVAVMTDTRVAEKGDKPDAAAKPAGAKKADPAAALDLPPQIVRLHTASSPFAVERNLKVELVTRRKGDAKAPIRPGDDVELVIKTTDPQGKPVSSELSVAMIDPSLLSLFGWNVGAIDDAFRGNPRQAAMPPAPALHSLTIRPPGRLTGICWPRNSEPKSPPKKKLRLQELSAAADASVSTVAGVDVPHDDLATPADGAESIRADLMSVDEAQNYSFFVGGGRGRDGRQLQQGNQKDFDPLIDSITSSVDQDGNGNGVIEDNSGSMNTAGRLSLGVNVNGDNPHTAHDRREIGGQGGGFGGAGFGFGGNAGGGGRGQPAYPNGANAAARSTNLPAYQTLVEPGPGVGGPGPGVALLGQHRSIGNNTYTGATGVDGHVLAMDAPHGDWSSTQSDAKKSGDVRFGSNASMATVQGFNTYWNEGRKDMVVVMQNGMQCNVLLAAADQVQFDPTAAGKQAAQLTAQGAMVVTQSGTQETGFWNPAVVTDEKGEATLTITVPEQSTAWKLLARGVTKETLAGDAEAELTAKKDLFGELKLSLAFTDGDDAEVIVTVHNDLIDNGQITITLKTTIGGRSVEDKKTLAVKKKGIDEVTFKTQIRRPAAEKVDSKSDEKSDAKANADDDSATFELNVASGEAKDTTHRVVPIHPYGVPVYAAASGAATSDTTVWVEPPADMPMADPHLQILIGPTVEQSLLDVVFGNAPACAVGCRAVFIRPGCRNQRSDGLPRAAKIVRRHPRCRRPAIASAGCPHPFVVGLAGFFAARRRRLDVDRPRPGQPPLHLGPRGLGTVDGPQSRLQTGRSAFRKGQELSAKPDCHHGRNRFRKQSHFAPRAVGHRQRRFHAGQSAVPQSAGPQQCRTRLSGVGVCRNGSQTNRARIANRSGQARSERFHHAPRADLRFAALGWLAGRNSRSVRFGAGRSFARRCQNEGNDGLAHGPSHRPPLVAGKSHRPRHVGFGPLVRPGAVRSRALSTQSFSERF